MGFLVGAALFWLFVKMGFGEYMFWLALLGLALKGGW